MQFQRRVACVTGTFKRHPPYNGAWSIPLGRAEHILMHATWRTRHSSQLVVTAEVISSIYLGIKAQPSKRDRSKN